MTTTIPLVVVCGPTATGKTDVALAIAKKLNGELVSADSRQIYKGMDIGTGKDLPKNSRFEVRNSKLQPTYNKYSIGYYVVDTIPLWLYDIVTPDKQFSAGAYAEIAHAVIADIYAREKLPILVGGSGLYIRSVVEGFDTGTAPADWDLRKKLEKEPIDTLQQALSVCDPEKLAAMNQSDRRNPRRLIRAIEIARVKLKTLPQPHTDTYHSVYIGITAHKDIVQKNIIHRVEKRVEQGILAEISSLLTGGYSWSDPGFNTLGYKEWKPYFENQVSVNDIVKRWAQNEISYAKRQLTWFKKNKKIQWFDTSEKRELILSHLNYILDKPATDR